MLIKIKTNGHDRYFNTETIVDISVNNNRTVICFVDNTVITINQKINDVVQFLKENNIKIIETDWTAQ